MLLSLWAAICMLIYKLTTWQCRNSSNQFILKNWTFIQPHTGIRNLVVRIWMCRMVPSILPIGLWEPHTHCMAYTGWGVTKTRNGKRNGMENVIKRKICNAIYVYLRIKHIYTIFMWITRLSHWQCRCSIKEILVKK